MKLTLRRVLELERATLGVLEVRGAGDVLARFATLEDPPSEGKGPIPLGRYELEPHSGPAYPRAWAIVGGEISHYPEPGKRWSTVLFHVGNTSANTRGCVLVGEQIDVDVQAIRQSAVAMRRLLALLEGEERHQLEIVRG